MQRDKSVYGDPTNRAEMLDNMRVLRRRFLRYKDAEIVYSLEHKKLIELADDAGALYRQGNTVLINREMECGNHIWNIGACFISADGILSMDDSCIRGFE